METQENIVNLTIYLRHQIYVNFNLYQILSKTLILIFKKIRYIFEITIRHEMI